MSSLFKRPKMPPPPPPPPPPDDSAERTAAAEKERKLRAAATGRASTMLAGELTDGSGVSAKKKLLGA